MMDYKLLKINWQWLGFAVIAFFVLIAYAPSLMHLPRADQIMYLAEVGPKRTLWDLTIGCIDLNRHRLFGPGDEILFRPVDYILLGLEKYFFGYDFMLWQGLGIVLHLVVIWFLLRLLLAVHQGISAIVFTAFFALMFVNIEMVTWHHINAYMLFIISMLAALWHFMNIVEDKPGLGTGYWAMTLWLVLGAFTHEMGNIVAIILGVYVWIIKPQQRRHIKFLFAVPLIYALTSYLNDLEHPFIFTALNKNGVQSPLNLLKDTFYAVGAWGYSGLFHFEQQWLMAARNMIAPNEVHLIKPLHILTMPTFLALGAAALFVVCAVRQKTNRVRLIYASLAFLLTIVFALIIALGRASQWGIWDVVRINTYYMYIFWVFAVIGLYAMADWGKIGNWQKGFLLAFMILLMMFNACKLYSANAKAVKDNNAIIVLVNTLNMLIKEHGKEPGFSFYVDPTYSGNYIYSEMRRTDDPKDRQYSFIEAIYPQYFTTDHPRYRLMAHPNQ